MNSIKKVSALEILDSRGRPTVKATCELLNGIKASASVPSGASTGAAEALELRDQDKNRYQGLGCLQAVDNINIHINQSLCGQSFADQRVLDSALCELDGTANKSNLGANAILAVSLAYGRVTAVDRQIPFYQYFSELLEESLSHLPLPMINLFSGGMHAGGQVPIQDVLIVPISANTINQALMMSYDVYQSAAKIVRKKYHTRPLTADEGGLAPNFSDVEDALITTINSIEDAGYTPGKDITMALDIAASHFYCNGVYKMDDQSLSSEEMIDVIDHWVEKYPIISIEDGLFENDWNQWRDLLVKIEGRALVMGDDLLCTSTERIQKAIEMKAANALLLKVNQVGTISESLEAYKLARGAGWSITLSARSGETEDNWLADLAVGWCGDYIKIGSITQSERLAKYNRLLEIEAETGLRIAGRK